MLRPVLFLLIASGLCVPLSVRASPADEFGALPRGIGTAGALTDLGTDSGGAFYNPASLALAGESGHPSLQFGYVNAIPALWVQRHRNDDAAQAHATVNPTDQGWITAATLIPIGGKVKNAASLGIVIYVPQDKFIRVESLDPQAPHWQRYQADPDRLVAALGLGARVHRYLSVGAGVHVLAGIVGHVTMNTDLFNGKVLQRDISFNLVPAFAPSAGLTFGPFGSLKFSVSWRGPLEVHVKLPTQVQLDTLGQLGLVAEGTVDYSPHQVALGASFSPVARLNLTATLKWEHWSSTPNPALDIHVVGSGTIVTFVSPQSALDFGTGSPNPLFSDTVTPALAGEYAFPGEMWILRAGAAWRPTFVPRQTAVTNFADADAWIVGLGTTLQFKEPLEIFPNPLKLDFGGQAQLVTRRTMPKSDPVDPVGTYDIGGAVFALGASLRYDF